MVVGSNAGGLEFTSDVDAFIARWQLQEDWQMPLLELAPDVREAVMAGFAPKVTTKNVDALLHGYIKSMQTGPKPKAAVGKPGNGTLAAERKAIEAWCWERGLDEICAVALMEMGPEQRADAIARFAPKPNTRNPTGLFLGFLRSVRGGPKSSSTGGSQLQGAYVEWSQAANPIGDNLLSSPVRVRPSCGQFGSVGVAEGLRGVVDSEYFGEGMNTIGAEDALAIEQFIQTWGLDEESLSLLMSASLEARQEVISSFNPKPGTRDVKNMLAAFLRSVSQRIEWDKASSRGATRKVHAVLAHESDFSVNSGCAAVEQTDRGMYGDSTCLDADEAQAVERFAQTWDLDDDTISLLLSVSPEARQEAIKSFNPKPDTRDVKGLLAGFLRSISQRIQKASIGSSHEAGVFTFHEPAMSADGREASAPDTLQGVIDAACLSIEEAQAMEHFAETFNLDDESVSLLLSSSPEVRKEAMKSFCPKPGTRNVKSLLSGFLRSISQRIEGGVVSTGLGPHENGASVTHESDIPKQNLDDAGGLASFGLVAFAETWGLDDECVSLLVRAKDEVRQEVVRSFHPKTGTRDVKSLFKVFLNSVSQRVSAESVNTWRAYNDSDAWPRTAFKRPETEASPDVADFARTWNLDDESIASLMSVTTEARQDAMSSFQPKHGTRNVNWLFQSFLRSVSERVEKEALRIGNASRKSGAGTSHTSSTAAFPSRATDRFEDSHSVSEFAKSRGLDDECISMLMSVTQAVRKEVMTSFSPKPGTRNVKGLLTGFLRSVSQRMGGDGLAKGTLSAGLPLSGRGLSAMRSLKRPSDDEDPPQDDVIEAFAETWGLDENCLINLMSYPAHVQWDVINSFTPKADMEDVNGQFLSYLATMSFGPIGKRTCVREPPIVPAL